jgi:hypothetical protein
MSITHTGKMAILAKANKKSKSRLMDIIYAEI